MSQLPNAFHPLVDPITTFSRAIERAEYLPQENQVQLSWKENLTDPTFENATYDHAIFAVPFSKMRTWRFPNTGKHKIFPHAESVGLVTPFLADKGQKWIQP